MSCLTKSEAAFHAAPVRSNGERVEIPKAAQVVASRIRRRIIDGDLKRGERLSPEAELAVGFAVSRPIVREALRILESEHFIKLARGTRKGATINQPTLSIVARATGIALRMKGATLGDVYEACALTESAAARFAALRRPKEASSALLKHVAYEIKVAGDRREFLRAIADFDRVLLEECGHMTLSTIGQALTSVVGTHIGLARERRTHPAEESSRRAQLGLRSHQRLVDLIAARDGAGAEAHWLLHMNVAGKCWLDGLSRSSVIEIFD